MANCLISAVQDIGRCILTQFVWPLLNPHVDYWLCFDDNIQSLNGGIQNLKGQKDLIEHRRDEKTPARVVEWLKQASETLAEGERILLVVNIPAWNITSRYSMGKRAKQTAEAIAKLLINGNFNTTPEFESRKGIENKIIDSLKQSSVGMIGICGMGGVGKTTMAKRIKERVKEEDLFEEVVIVTVSQTIDMPKIQNEIAGCLNLEFDEKSTRADKLRTRLMDTKRKIIILDDVWDPCLMFEELGIPIESNCERCKVLLTSRSTDTCRRFKNKVVFELKILEEEEAWILFKENAGKCDGDPNVHRLAKQVAKECKGLPIALVTVGLALQDTKDTYIWENALSQLRKADPEDFPSVLRYVYKPLKLSYDFLSYDFPEKETLEKVQYLFLLCCLFPEDFNISVEQLTWYSMGLGLFDDRNNIEEARKRTHTWVGKLENRCLLIDLQKKGKKGFVEVKMHDVLRDVAIHIGSKEKPGFLKRLSSVENSSDVNCNDVDCNWMSVEQMEVPLLSRFPKLRLLMLLKLSSNQFSDISFEGMEALNVLSFESISIRSLPPTLGSLKNLQSLRLFRCEVENISVIGKLTSLKVLSCCECQYITELPAEIGRLKDLRLLELNRCSQLRRIPFGIISSLFQLEELKIPFNFSEWERGGESRNASLTELERLRNLTCLEILISDLTLSAQEIRLSQKLVRYSIRIADKGYIYFGDGDYEKEMHLLLPGAVGNWIQLLARNAEYLHLIGDGSGNINLAEMGNLRSISISHCSTVKKLVDTSYLYQNDSLCHLKFINIIRCDNLRYLFSASAVRRCLLQLEGLHIGHCESMEQVFWIEGTTHGCIEFPKLKALTLGNLPNLTSFCRGLENIIINFPNLTLMEIEELPKLNSLSPLNSETDDHNTRFHLFCNSKVLLQLEILGIEGCDSMEQVFWNEIEDINTDGCIEFPNLKELTLLNLPNLTTFCQGLENIIIKFPNLTQMRIGGLPKLNCLSRLNSEAVGRHDQNTSFVCNPKDDSFGNLDEIYIKGCDNLRNLFSVFSVSVARRCLLQLENLYIEDCNAMEQVFWNEGTDDNTDCIEFPKLKELTLENMPNLTAFCQGLENIIFKIPNLTQMKIRNLPKLNSIFPLNSKDLLRLEILRIEDCESMEQVFWNEVRDDNTDSCIEFPKLKELTLRNLPNLTAFCQGLENIIIKFPNLTKMDIGGLPKLNSLSPLDSETVVRHDHNTCFHFVCNPKVEMGLLENLELSKFEDNIKNIWCHQIPNNFFNNLQRFQISYMNGIRSLMSTSIAKNLVSLAYLDISHCEEMVEVIEIDDDNDKQAVDINCLFPNLRQLELQHLHKLIWFWQWNHALELPLLEKIDISYCRVMETFTLGSINTPNFKRIYVHPECIIPREFIDKKDLNNIIHYVWTKSQDAFETKEDWTEEDGDEDANKDENRDERKYEYDNENVNKDKDDNENVNKNEDDNEKK